MSILNSLTLPPSTLSPLWQLLSSEKCNFTGEEKGLHFSEMYGLEVMKPRLDGIFLFLVFSFEILFPRPLLTCSYSWLEEMETKIMDGKLPWSLSGKEYAC